MPYSEVPAFIDDLKSIGTVASYASGVLDINLREVKQCFEG